MIEGLRSSRMKKKSNRGPPRGSQGGGKRRVVLCHWANPQNETKRSNTLGKELITARSRSTAEGGPKKEEKTPLTPAGKPCYSEGRSRIKISATHGADASYPAAQGRKVQLRSKISKNAHHIQDDATPMGHKAMDL